MNEPMYQPQLFGGEHVETGESNSDWWCTPPELGALVRLFYPAGFTDPCSNPLSTMGATTTFELADDGLAQDWRGPQWVNPPYSDCGPWLKRCSEMPARGGEALALPKGDWTTKWWWDYIRTASARCLLRGRVSFVLKAGSTTAPFPSVLVYWGPRVARFRELFGPLGEILTVPPGTEQPSPCTAHGCEGGRSTLPRRADGRKMKCGKCHGTGLDPHGDLPSAPGYSS